MGSGRAENLFLFWFQVRGGIGYALPMKHGPYIVELTPEESVLADAIEYDPHALLSDTQKFHANGELVVRLTSSLLKRKAIPDQRLSYFSDSEFNLGGRGSSRRDSFIKHGHDDDLAMRHGHFLKFLRYFIYGADLPKSVLQTFAQAVDDCGSITSGDIAPLGSTARQLARTHRLVPKAAADEFSNSASILAWARATRRAFVLPCCRLNRGADPRWQSSRVSQSLLRSWPKSSMGFRPSRRCS